MMVKATNLQDSVETLESRALITQSVELLEIELEHLLKEIDEVRWGCEQMSTTGYRGYWLGMVLKQHSML